MKNQWHSRLVVGWVTLVAILGLCAPAQADTVKLKDGTVLEGTVLEQTETEVVLERRFGSGSITSKETIARSNIAELILASPEEKARQLAEEAYQATRKYQLEDQRSFSLEYYDSVIEKSFRKFLNDYPNSSHAQEIAEKIMQWSAERDKVAEGQVKLQGEWMSAERAQRLTAQDKAEGLIRQGKALLGTHRYAEAVKMFQQVVSLDPNSVAAEIANRCLGECYQSWHQYLAQRQQSLTAEIPQIETRIAELAKIIEQAQQELRQAQSGFKAPSKMSSSSQTSGTKTRMGDSGSGGVVRMGTDTSRNANATTRLSAAQSELYQLQNRLPAMKAELEEGKRLMAQLDSKATELGVSLANANTTGTATTASAQTAPATPSSPSESETGESDLLAQIAQFWKNYWIYLAGGAVILVWFVSRKLGQ